MKKVIISALIICLLLLVACQQGEEETATPSSTSPDETARTAYGFFPSPPEATAQSILDVYEAIGQHADVVMIHQNVPWEDFLLSADAESKTIIDLTNQFTLASQNGLEVIVLVDPLNSMNRHEIFGLPADWEASFANEQIRTAFTNFALRIVREFQPEYVGLASEINTYADSHPDDFQHYLSLYNSVYDLVKAEAPETQIFVTFQWEELNNLIPAIAQGEPNTTNWEQVEQFEPKLDLWAISSYPYIAYPSAKEIPADYYSRLLTRTSKPLAVAEGGFTSRPVDSLTGTPQDQVDYLSAIHSQIGGSRLVFWIYILFADFSVESYTEALIQLGMGDEVLLLGIFAAAGICDYDYSPKPALATWDSFRSND